MCAKHPEEHCYSNFSFCLSFIPYLVIFTVLEEQLFDIHFLYVKRVIIL